MRASCGLVERVRVLRREFRKSGLRDVIICACI